MGHLVHVVKWYVQGGHTSLKVLEKSIHFFRTCELQTFVNMCKYFELYGSQLFRKYRRFYAAATPAVYLQLVVLFMLVMFLYDVINTLTCWTRCGIGSWKSSNPLPPNCGHPVCGVFYCATSLVWMLCMHLSGHDNTLMWFHFKVLLQGPAQQC